MSEGAHLAFDILLRHRPEGTGILTSFVYPAQDVAVQEIQEGSGYFLLVLLFHMLPDSRLNYKPHGGPRFCVPRIPST